jgi:hypothetical protein
MIKLTNYYKSAKSIWLNPKMIESMEEYIGTSSESIYTNVKCSSGTSHNVIETPEYILEKIDNYYIIERSKA